MARLARPHGGDRQPIGGGCCEDHPRVLVDCGGWHCARSSILIVIEYSLVLSQSSIFGQNPKILCHEFNDLQTAKLSKKRLCDRTPEKGQPATFPAPNLNGRLT
jgi:hypothetical protein